jgi:hypothetical protein
VSTCLRSKVMNLFVTGYRHRRNWFLDKRVGGKVHSRQKLIFWICVEILPEVYRGLNGVSWKQGIFGNGAYLVGGVWIWSNGAMTKLLVSFDWEYSIRQYLYVKTKIFLLFYFFSLKLVKWCRFSVTDVTSVSHRIIPGTSTLKILYDWVISSPL